MRLDKYLSECKIGTRSEIKKLLKQGIVTVNDKAVSTSDMQINESNDKVCVNGRQITYKKYVYLMLNKPAGYLSATWDKSQPVVCDLVPEEYRAYEVFPVGRLDIDTEGLLILTNDGDFNHKLTSPKKNVYKKYFAKLDAPAEKSDIAVFKAGIELKDFTTKPAVLEICDDPHEVYVHIAEGKFHQVKRMCAYVGKNVTYLKRVAIGDVTLDDMLPLGSIRELTNEELNKLLK